MSLTTKVVITLLTLLGSYCGFSYGVMQHVMPPAFERLEQDLLSARLDGARRALQDNLDDIEQRALRWLQSVSLEAAAGGWSRDRLKPGHLASLDVVLLIEPSGEIAWHRIIAGGDWELPPEKVFAAGFGERINGVDLQRGDNGVIVTKRSLMLAVVTDLRSADPSQPARRMLFGRFLGADLLRAIKQFQQTDVQILDAGMLPAGAAEVVFRHNSESLHGYAEIHDLWGKRAAVLKFSTPRTVTELSDRVIKSSTLVLSVVGALVTLLMWLLLRQVLLRPIGELTRQINTVGGVVSGGEPALRATEAARLNTYKQLLGKITPKLPLTERSDEIGKLAVAFSDLSTRLQQSADRVWQLAYEDSLTGLPNRSLFMERIKASVSRSTREKRRFALLFMDLDGFKAINDTLGHDAGDELLQVVAERLRGCVRKLDVVERRGQAMNGEVATVARFGGDEFVMLLNEVRVPSDTVIVAERIIQALSQPIALKAGECTVGASIGIATFPDDGQDVEGLVKCADIAMYRAKHKGKNTYHVYSKSIDDELLRQLELERDLASAVRKNQLRLHYQPQVELSSGRTIAVEALLRWEHPRRGMIPPDRFIPIAEKNGLINQLGQWVLEQACQQARRWRDMGIAGFRVAVNVSNKQLECGGFTALVDRITREAGVDPQLLEVELTETSLIKAKPEALRELIELRELGVRISIDDFGTGYSSLSLLRELPIDAFKIDRSFLSDVETAATSRAVAAAIITLGRELDLGVVAEGVETEGMLNFLRHQGGSTAQGFLFAKPMSAAAVTPLLQFGAVDPDVLQASLSA